MKRQEWGTCVVLLAALGWVTGCGDEVPDVGASGLRVVYQEAAATRFELAPGSYNGHVSGVIDVGGQGIISTEIFNLSNEVVSSSISYFTGSDFGLQEGDTAYKEFAVTIIANQYVNMLVSLDWTARILGEGLNVDYQFNANATSEVASASSTPGPVSEEGATYERQAQILVGGAGVGGVSAELFPGNGAAGDVNSITIPYFFDSSTTVNGITQNVYLALNTMGPTVGTFYTYIDNIIVTDSASSTTFGKFASCQFIVPTGEAGRVILDNATRRGGITYTTSSAGGQTSYTVEVTDGAATPNNIEGAEVVIWPQQNFSNSNYAGAVTGPAGTIALDLANNSDGTSPVPHLCVFYYDSDLNYYAFDF